MDKVFTGHRKDALGTSKNTLLQDFVFHSCTKIGMKHQLREVGRPSVNMLELW
jgi:hypothetical protein